MRIVRLALISLAALAFLSSPAASRAADADGFKVDGEKFQFTKTDLSFRGLLMKPTGKGPFPAILISHGLGSNGERFGRMKAKEWVAAGFVCIAPDYTHSDPQGDRSKFGASAENVRRAKACLDYLQSLPEVDGKRLYAYGNSMGAFLTIGLAADDSDRLAAIAITAGGINPVGGFAAPSSERAAKIRTPSLILHGTTDTTVPPERSKLLEDVLKKNNVVCERLTFDGIGHDLQTSRAKEVNAKITDWFGKYPAKKAN